MPHCLIGLGANLGDRAASLSQGVSALAATPSIVVRRQSRWHETAPVGGRAGQGAYLNGVIVVETSLPPEALLARLAEIERDLGRVRAERWSARTIDLDLLLYDEVVLATPRLTLPHPRMAWRRFVLEPAAEVAAEMRHPVIGWTVARLLRHLSEAAHYLAIAGPSGVGKSRLAAALLAQTPGRLLADPAHEVPKAQAAIATGPAWQMEMELLAPRRALLESADWPHEPGGWTVSDFWFDQAAAWADVWLDGKQRATLIEAWQAARDDVQHPKLLVVLEPDDGDAAAGRLSGAIVARSKQPDQGPVLRLAAADWDNVLAETKAALAAMS